MTWLLRVVVIWNTVTSAVTATHSHGRAFPAFHGVSSALTTGAAGSVATAAATGVASAALVAWHNVPTLPTLSGASRTVSLTSAISRHDSRNRPLSVATVACIRGPKAPAGTSAGSVARVVAPQRAQATRCKRCSLTTARTGGSSVTWCAT
jgi:hypothetical protein